MILQSKIMYSMTVCCVCPGPKLIISVYIIVPTAFGTMGGNTLPFSRPWKPLLVQFIMVFMRSEKPRCTSPSLSVVSSTLPLKQFQRSSDWQWPFLILSRKIVKHFLFLYPIFQAISGVMSLGLCLQIVSQAPQHFRSSLTFCALISASAPEIYEKLIPQRQNKKH